MRVRDRFDFVVQSLRESRVFFAVNVVAISLGVSLLTVLLALSSGIEQAIKRMMAEQVSPLLIEVIAGSSADASVTAKGVAEMRAIPHVARAEPVIMPIFAELYRSPSQHVFISAMSTAGAGDPELTKVRWAAGSAAPLARADNALLLPADVARLVGWYDAVRLPGQKVTLRFIRKRGEVEEVLDLPAVITGVPVETRVSRCYLPYRTMARLAAWHSPAGVTWDQQQPADGVTKTAYLYADSVDSVPAIRAVLEKRGYRTTSILDTVKAYGKILLIARLVLGIIAAVAFIAGAASIFNATYASVLRRFREFAVFKTYGASRKDLYALVLSENIVTAVVAALVGFGLAAAGCVILNRAVGEKIGGDVVPVELSIFLLALVVAVITCIVASLIPARMAARSSVIDAIAAARDR